jgi:hypothetical protein
MILESKMNHDNCVNWTNEGTEDSAGDAFGEQDPSGGFDWVETTGDNRMPSLTSPQQPYHDPAHAPTENQFGAHASHFTGGYYNGGMGLPDGEMEGMHPGHPGIEHDSKPAARPGGGDPIHRMQSPVVTKLSINKRHSISNDPYEGYDSGERSLYGDHGDHETPTRDKIAHLADDDDLAVAPRYPRAVSMAMWPASYDPNLVPGLSTEAHPTAAASGPGPVCFHFGFTSAVTSGQAPVVPSPVVPPPQHPPLSKRTTRRKKSKATAAPLTESGERTSQARRGPTKRESAEATTPRGGAALGVWYKRLNELWVYKDNNGDCLVPQKHIPNPSLGIWVNKQRMEKKSWDEGLKSSMTEGKMRALGEVGFIWAKPKGQASWDAKYKELKLYTQRNGNCNVPTKYSNSPALGRWVSTQRSQYKQYQLSDKTHMTTERFNKLSILGFKWNMMD